jgi:Glycosyl transferase family 2
VSYTDLLSSVTPSTTPTPRAFKCEAVVVCENYADFLRHTLPENKHLFDRIVVVTSHLDKNTQRVCEFYHVECVQTDASQSHVGKFCKGAAINKGLERLNKDGWVVHLDADIWLPPQTKRMLENANLDRTCVYGIDRYNVSGPRVWEDFLAMPRLQHECDAWIHMNTFPLGTRVASFGNNGYVPIGFFQMFSPKDSGIERYPEGHTNAGREDMLFSLKWPRAKRHLIPEIIGYHLESGDAKMSSNWKGRTTAPFVL